MKKINLVVLVLALVFVQSCSKKDTEEEKSDSKSYALNERGVQISILDNQNQDLLDSLTPNYYAYDNMKLYYLEDGKKQEINDPDAQFPKNLKFYKKDGLRIMTVFVSDKSDTLLGKQDVYDVGRSITYLELNKSTVDTIISEWERGVGYFSVKKIWYNGNYHELNGKPYQVKKDVN